MPAVSTGQFVVMGLAALLAFWAVGAYNRLVQLRGAAVAVWAPIDTQLRRRQALAFELAEVLAGEGVMGDAAGRASLESLAAATRQAQAAADHALVRPSRAGAVQSLGVAEQVLDGALRPLRARIESGGLWEAGGGSGTVEEEIAARLQSLLEALDETEAQLAFTRQRFNEAVDTFNEAVRELPTCLLASVFGFQPAAALPAPATNRGGGATGSEAAGSVAGGGGA